MVYQRLNDIRLSYTGVFTKKLVLYVSHCNLLIAKKFTIDFIDLAGSMAALEIWLKKLKRPIQLNGN